MRNWVRKFIILVFIVFTVGLRWVFSTRLLPQTWTSDSEVRITARVVEEPSLNDRNYIIRVGRVIAVFSAYKGVEVGDYVELVGKAKVRVIGKKQVQVVLYDPSIYTLLPDEKGGVSFVDNVRVYLVKMRNELVSHLQKNLPEPHASLSAGILLGVKSSVPEDFYQALVNTGTLHVIAASGYNVTIVLRVVMGLVLLWFSREVGLVLGFAAVAAYVVLAGGSPAVVRAGFMGIVAYSAYFWGRVVDAKRLLWVVSYLMVLIDPLMLVDVGFQLSVAATAGILYFEPYLRKRVESKYVFLKTSKLGEFLAESLYPTLAASLFTLPIILWAFGRVSWISPFANVLVLWLVPIIMFLSALVVLAGIIWSFAGRVVSLLLYVPLELFIRIVEMLG